MPHETGRVATQGLTAAAKIVVAIAVTLATGGAGGNLCMSVGQTVAGGLQLSGLAASVVTSVVAGATSTLITKATVSIIDHRGNVVETGKEFADAQVWKDLAKDAAITAIVGASPYGGESFTSRLMNHALRSLVTAGADMACGEKARDAFRRAGINFLVNVVQSEVARQIGGWRKEALDQKDEFGKPVTLESDVMNYVMHKAMHAALAGAIQASSAALQGADREAILKAVAGGAIGAAVAEVVAEFLKDEVMERIEERTKAETAGLSGKDLNDARGKIKSEELTRLTTLAQLAATSTVLLSRYDVAAASAAALNAVQNNAATILGDMIDQAFAKMSPVMDLFAVNQGNEGQPKRRGRSNSFTTQRIMNDIDEAYDLRDAAGNALGAKSLGMQCLQAFANVVMDEEDVCGIGGQHTRLAIRRTYVDAPKVVREGMEILADRWAGRAVDSSRIDAFKDLGSDWLGNVATVGLMGCSMKGAGKMRVMPNRQVRGNATSSRQLLSGEGKVDTYGALKKISQKGDNLSAHHIPHKQFMESVGVHKNDGISIFVEDPFPGSGGRHRRMHDGLKSQRTDLAPRDALAQGVRKAKEVYREDGLSSQIRPGLQGVIGQNKEKFPGLFSKQGGNL